MVFNPSDLYRTGGDEFIVIISDVDKKEFKRSVQKLRSEKTESVSFAVGEFWSDGSVDLTTSLRIADELMYEDKKAYYDRNPELRRQ